MNQLPIHLENKKLHASFEKYILEFITPAKTSRETFKSKETYLLKVSYDDNSITGQGECSPLWTLSIDPQEEYIHKLQFVCDHINDWATLLNNLSEFPSILFGLETALLDLSNGGHGIILPSNFTNGKRSLKINGLIWMGSFEYMSSQIEQKIKDGYDCVKLKIGAINWDAEFKLLQDLRNRFSAETMEIRVDANGAFSYSSALEKLDQLKQLDIHSIEQPIAAGQINEMAQLCKKSELDIALDEELIGNFSATEKKQILSKIKPAYIIIKPSLIGGITNTLEWIELAEHENIKWWLTSALEGNIALNSIAQIAAFRKCTLAQGLGTGQLFKNNFTNLNQLKSDQLSKLL